MRSSRIPRTALVAALALGIGTAAPAWADGYHDHDGFGPASALIGFAAGVIAAPLFGQPRVVVAAPVYAPPPPPVMVAQPVYGYAPPPAVVYAPAPRYGYDHDRGWHRGWHRGWDHERDWR